MRRRPLRPPRLAKSSALRPHPAHGVSESVAAYVAVRRLGGAEWVGRQDGWGAGAAQGNGRQAARRGADGDDRGPAAPLATCRPAAAGAGVPADATRDEAAFRRRAALPRVPVRTSARIPESFFAGTCGRATPACCGSRRVRSRDSASTLRDTFYCRLSRRYSWEAA
jgi:hypothetical protein